MEKKVELILNNRTIRVMPHMIEDMLRLGATRTKKILKDVPKELLLIPELKKVDPLPQMENVTEIKVEEKPKVRRERVKK